MGLVDAEEVYVRSNCETVESGLDQVAHQSCKLRGFSMAFKNNWFDLSSPKPPYSEKWMAARAWYQDFRPDPEKDYSISLEEARSRYAELVEESEKKDQKAQWLFKAGFTASAGAIAILVPWNLSPAVMVPTLVFLVASMMLAIRTTTPAIRPTPLTVKNVLEAEEHDLNPAARLAASYYLATEGVKSCNFWKSRMVRRAAIALVLAAMSFTLPVVSQFQPSGSEVNSQTQSDRSAQGENKKGLLEKPVATEMSEHR